MPVENIEIPKHYRTQYKDNVEHLLNNEGSILRPHVMEQPIEGERASIVDQYGVRRGREDTERNGDTPTGTTPRDRRWIFPRTFDWGELLDRKDKLRTVLDPTQPIVTGAAWGLGENIDYDLIIPAFFGDAKVGKEAETIEQFDTANFQVGVQTGSSPAADVGMNKKKIQVARKLLRKAKNKFKREKPVLAITAEQEDNLLDELQLTSADFVSGRPIETGELGRILGVQLVMIEDLEVDSNGFRRCPMWLPSGIQLGIEEEIFIEIERRGDKKFNVQVYAALTMGATRTQQGKVVEILCKE